MSALGNGDVRQQNRVKTAKYILEHRQASRQEIATALGFSLPTVFQYVNELMEKGLIQESGAYGSTGGRKAKILKICGDFRYAIGVEVKKNSVPMVLLDLSGSRIDGRVCPLRYENSPEYYQRLGQAVQEFAAENGFPDGGGKLLGVGISLPGIIDPGLGLLRQSYALDVSNVGLQNFTRNLPYEVCFENDANNAACAEINSREKNTVYLSLNDTVGGAIFLRSDIYQGDNFKSAEFGHMTIVPGGRQCYCGKRGCVDPYCSAQLLRCHGDGSLETFFSRLDRGDPECGQVWEDYLQHLTVAVSNLRIIFDCDVILGGDVGGYLQKYVPAMEDRLRAGNQFDPDLSYLRVGKFRGESSAIGAAHQMIRRFIGNPDTLQTL